MLLYACASCVLGWAGISCATQHALQIRGYAQQLSTLLRVLILAVCGCGAIASWAIFENAALCLIFSFACACISAILVCDLREHIIPTEFVAILVALAVSFRFLIDGATGLLAVGIPAAFIAGLLFLLNHLRVYQNKPELIGAGDVRMILPLALFSGSAGVIYGIFAAALVMSAISLIQLITKRANLHTNIALAPGLVAWFFVGTLIPFL